MAYECGDVVDIKTFSIVFFVNDFIKLLNYEVYYSGGLYGMLQTATRLLASKFSVTDLFG